MIAICRFTELTVQGNPTLAAIMLSLAFHVLTFLFIICHNNSFSFFRTSNIMLLLAIFVAGIAILIITVVHILFNKPIPIWSSTNMHVKGPYSRRLGYMEMYYAEMAKSGIHNVSFVLHLQSDMSLTEYVVHKALITLLKTQPSLQMRLGKEGDWFTYMRKMDNVIVDFTVNTSTNWKGVMEEDVGKVFDAENGPLWRVLFLPEVTYENEQNPACIFTFHHSIVDGISSCHLFEHFLGIIGGSAGNPINELPLMPSYILPPMESFVQSDSFIKTWTWNKTVLLSSAKCVLHSIVEKLFFGYVCKKKTPETIPKKVKILTNELSKDQTSKLLQACKKHGVTVHVALQTAVSIADIMLFKGGKITEHLCAISAVNMRPYLTSGFPQNYLGFYALLLFTDTNIDPNLPFWQLALKIKEEFHGKLKAKAHITRMASLPYFRKQMKSKVDLQLCKEAKCDIFISNFGNMSFLNDRKSRKVNLRALFILSASTGLEQVFDNFVITFNGKLFWSSVYHGYVTSESKARQFVAFVKQILLRATKE